MISEPIIQPLLNGYKFLWCQGDEWVFSITIVKLTEHRDTLTGELTVEHINKTKPSISGVRFNLTSQAARNTVSKRLIEAKILEPSDAYDGKGVNFPQLIDQICGEVIKRHREGEPYQELWTSEDVPPLEYLIDPILLKGIPTVIFGEKGVTKSTIALLLYVVLLLPWEDNPLGLKAPEHSVKTLILDWETPGNIVQLNAKKLQEGMGLPGFPLYHRRCNTSLSDDLEPIMNMIQKIEAEVVIIDSLARAAGGELSKDTENANRFFASLDKLRVTSLILAQTSKDTESKRKTIYGNALYTYYARSIFELCKSQEAGEDDMSVALFHRWANLTKLQKPMGFHFHYNGMETTVESEPVSYSEFRTKISTQSSILNALKPGPMEARELAQVLDLSESNIRMSLSRLSKKGKIVKIGKEYGLASDREE